MPIRVTLIEQRPAPRSHTPSRWPTVETLGLAAVAWVAASSWARANGRQDTVSSRVLMTITEQDIAEHQAVLAVWAEANGLDPHRIALRPITVEQVGTRTVICYRETQPDPVSGSMLDPWDRTEVRTVRRSVDQRVSLAAAGYPPALAAEQPAALGEVTEGDAGGDHPGG
ncbi:hypothetical protein [Streptomyces sp. NPDC006638]|uniref:hypothetical protein n=1 Tax=Streptomyces sp. NPDC006638 TaxID=3157183 RepID=UPI0033B35802